MEWRRKSDLGWLAAVLFYVGLYSGGYVKHRFFSGWPHLGFLIVYVLLGCLIYYLVAVCTNSLIALLSRVRLAQTVCKHGVKGGETLDKCEYCKADKQAFENQLKIEAAERARKEQIKGRAIELRISEHERLTQARLHKLDYMLALSPVEFEQVCAELFRAADYEAVVTPPTNDVGVDIRLSKNGNNYVVQCKRFRHDNLVSRPDLQKLMGVVASERNDGAYFVTTSKFTAGATAFANANGIRLIDGGGLVQLATRAFGDADCKDYHALCPECGEQVTFNLYIPEPNTMCRNGHDVINDFDSSWFALRSKEGPPSCKQCGRPMRKVQGRRGAFWGCTAYPSCRFTVGVSGHSRA